MELKHASNAEILEPVPIDVINVVITVDKYRRSPEDGAVDS